jgi:hypothetical protein
VVQRHRRQSRKFDEFAKTVRSAANRSGVSPERTAAQLDLHNIRWVLARRDFSP